MTVSVFNMANEIEAVDPMVLALKAMVEGVLAKTSQMKFEICVSEALTNLVKHAQTLSPDEQIEIQLVLKETGAEVVIFDPEGAAPFDLRQHASDIASVEETSEQGRGIALILQCADRIDYSATNGRNRLLLAFDNAV